MERLAAVLADRVDTLWQRVLTTMGHRWAPGIAGMVLAFLLLGPALSPGALVNLDLVALEHWPFPQSFWGLGPELPRAVPLELLLSAVSSVTSAATAVKLLFVVSIAAAFTGAHRMANEEASPGSWLPWTTAFLYAASPFLLTRLAVGHLTVVAAYAVLPWVLRRLLHPSKDLARLTVACGALGLMGFFGGTVAGILVVTGLLTEPGLRDPIAVGLRFVATQLPWLVPGAIVLWSGTGLAGSAAFPTGVDGLGGALEVFAGNGFWQPLLQVGGAGGVRVAICGLALLALGVVGAATSGHTWHRRAALPAVIGLVLVFSEATPPVDEVYDAITDLGPLAALREPHRLLVLYLAWMSLTVPLGARNLAGRVGPAWRPAVLWAPAAIALVLAGPALWGVDDRVETFDVPPAWNEARERIENDPGTVLVLPWHRYLDIDFASDQRALNPAIRHFGPNVIVAGDLGLGEPSRETADPRDAFIEELLPAARRGDDVSAALGAAGVRWVLILHQVDYQQYLPLTRSGGLVPVLADAALDLLQVAGRSAPVVDATGAAVAFDSRPGPWITVDTDQAIEWSQPYQAGWLRGFSPGERTPAGTIAFGDGAGTIWYWPGLAALLGSLVGLVTWIRALGVVLWTHRHPVR